jgi:ABC-type Mn2+/Zn2+ transport system ATPase subunit
VDTTPAAHQPPPLICIHDVAVERGGRLALEIDRLDLPPGATAVVGPNGSGKSTLLHLVAGLLRPATGAVIVAGHPPSPTRADVAYVLQTHQVSPHLPVTGREVVALGRAPARGPFRRLTPVDRAAVTEALAMVEMLPLQHRHLSELSGGQRQRVFIAQGLAQGAAILLLDEPVAGLDLASTHAIRAAIDAEREAGRSVLVATHDLAEAARFDTVVLLAGRVVAAGSPRDVLVADRLREAYAGRVLDLDRTGLALDDGAHHDHHDHHDHEH